MATTSGFILLTAACRSTKIQRERVVMFPWQKWLRPLAIVLRCAYIFCHFVVIKNNNTATRFNRNDVKINKCKYTILVWKKFLYVQFTDGLLLTHILLMWRIGRAPNSILIYSYIQPDTTLHSLFISGNCSTCFGWYIHPSSGAHTTVSTASGICHTFTAICRYRGRVGASLSVLRVAYATQSTLKPVPTFPR
jgi:hypothetical protein